MQLATDRNEIETPAQTGLARMKPKRRVGLRTVLIGLVVTAVLLTAVIVHWSWSRTARDNIVDIAGQLNREIVASVDASWTFPLRFAEIVWGDGKSTHRETIELSSTREFGSKRFDWKAKASGWTWARVAVWDVAGNGAFVNPVWR